MCSYDSLHLCIFKMQNITKMRTKITGKSPHVNAYHKNSNAISKQFEEKYDILNNIRSLKSNLTTKQTG